MKFWESVKKVFHFIRQEPSILYSLFLIVLLPVAIWVNASLTIGSFAKNSNFLVRKEALSIGQVVSVIVNDKVGSPEALQREIEKIATDNPELYQLRVIRYDSHNSKFRVIASYDSRQVGNEMSDPALSLAWHQNQNIAYISGLPGKRFWMLFEPVYNEAREKIALVSFGLSMQKTDLLVAQAAKTSYLIAIFSIILTLLLVLQHTRLFRYLNLYKKLQVVDKAKDSFIRMSAHELLTPIVNIRGYIELLNDELKDSLSSDQKQYIDRVAVSAKNLTNLINDILEVARIERKAVDVTLENVSPRPIIKDVLHSFELKAKAKNLTLTYQEQSFPGLMRVNSHRLYEILNNLVSNAEKYTPAGGKIEIKEWIDEKTQRYCISVQDTGIGISGEEQKNLFQRFYRVKNKETRMIPGTGLGLWIVKNLCQEMGGSITLESMKGVGSKFTIAFPLVKEKVPQK